MKKIFKKRYAIIALLMTQVNFAQGGLSVNAEYLMDNYYLLHPAMAGMKNSTQLRFSMRNQWQGVDNAPKFTTVDGNTRLSDRSGVGFIFLKDQNGYHEQSGLKLSYAHHITFSESRYDLNQLSFGMSAGFARTSMDNPDYGSELKDSYFTVDAGAAYHYKNFFSMLTVKNLVSSRDELYSDAESNNKRQYLLGAGYAFGNTRYGTGWIYEPSTLIKYTEELEEVALDVNFKIYRQFEFGKIWAGVSYRTNFNGADYVNSSSGKVESQRLEYFTPLIGGNYKNVMFSYGYSQQTGDVKFSNSGFHQFTIGFNLFSKRSSLDCNCPTAKD